MSDQLHLGFVGTPAPAALPWTSDVGAAKKGRYLAVLSVDDGHPKIVYALCDGDGAWLNADSTAPIESPPLLIARVALPDVRGVVI